MKLLSLVGTSIISPALFDKFEAPRAAAFCRALKAAGGHAFVHACGKDSARTVNQASQTIELTYTARIHST